MRVLHEVFFYLLSAATDLLLQKSVRLRFRIKMDSQRTKKLSTVEESAKSDQQIETLDSSTIIGFNNMIKDKRFVKHRLLLEKISEYIQMSKASNKKWANKCRELTAKIAADESKYKEALRLLEQCESTNETLRKKIENSLKTVAEARESENRARETIHILNEQLVKAAEEKARIEEELEGPSDPKKLLQMNEELMTEKERLLEEMSALESESTAVKETQRRIDDEKRELNEVIEQCNREIQLLKVKCRNETNRKTKAQQELLIVKHNLENITNSFMEQAKKLERTEMNETCFSKQLEVKVEELEKALRELESSREVAKSLKQEFDMQAATLKEVISDCVKKTRDMKIKDEKIAELKTELSVLKKQYQSTLEKFNALRNLGSETDILTLKAEKETLAKQYDDVTNQYEDLSKQINDIKEDKDRMADRVVQAIEEVRKMESRLLTNEHLRHSLNTQMKKLENEAKEQELTIVYLEREKDISAACIGELQTKIDFLQEELRAQEHLNFPKRLAQADKKIANVMKLKEKSIKERNEYETKCAEAIDEVEQVQDFIQKQRHQLNYLHERLDQQEVKLKTTTGNLELSYKENHQVASKLRKKSEEYNSVVLEKKNLQEKCDLLTTHLHSLSNERDLLQQSLEKVVGEKHTLNTQLVHRNEEIKLLSERLQVQERTLNCGEMQYRQLQQDNFLLTTHVKSLVRTKALMGRQVASALKLRKELLQVHKNFIKEQTRAQALEEELLSPNNVHRWRILEGTDPEKYDMLRKIHTLQRQLIAKTQVLVQQSEEINTKDRLLNEMKDFVSERSVPNILNRYQTCISQLNKKDKTLKTVQSELKMYKAYFNDYQCEIKRLKTQRQSRKASRSILQDDEK